MDCWIASFPRSGNTYFRNILYFVYGIESSTWHKESTYPVDENYTDYRFVKTHLCPDELEPNDISIPAIYLVRDGRDSMVSIAHHRKDIVSPGSDFTENLKEAIVAAEGSFFGGWSENVNAWTRRAQLVIRYEDLIADPVATFKRVAQLIPLPEPQWDQLPSFEEMKTGKAEYGGTSKFIDPQFKSDEFSEKFFRKGRSGGWKKEMTEEIQDLFWNYHGDVMERMGYETHQGSVGQNLLLDQKAMSALGKVIPPLNKPQKKILIECSKLLGPGNDGVKRYLIDLLKGLEEVRQNGRPEWDFKLLMGDRILSLESYSKIQNADNRELHSYEKRLMQFKRILKTVLPRFIYEQAAGIYRKTDARKMLKTIRENNWIKTIGLKRTVKVKSESKQETFDLLHIPLPQNAVHLSLPAKNLLVTVHDMTHRLFPEYHEAANIELCEQGMKLIEEKDADVLSISGSTSDDLKKLTTIQDEKLHLVCESPDKHLFKRNVNAKRADSVRLKYEVGKEPYLLCLSTIEPRKNLPNTIKAYNQLRKELPELGVNLVIAGKFGWKSEHLDRELHLNDPGIIFTGFIEDEDLNVLYSEAVALCYVSVYEGFGLPPLEAMSCRTPVIYGNNSSMIEVVGDAGLAADADNVDEIKEQMKKMVADEALRESLAEKGYRRSFEFSWRRSIHDTIMVYDKVIQKNAGTQSAKS